MSGEKLLLEAMILIRDTTQDRTSNRIAALTLAQYKADTVINYITKENSEPSQIPNCS